ncbi:MAG: N-acetylmuramoyl-L-alanine amidase [Syntrophobacteraceae bacterium]
MPSQRMRNAELRDNILKAVYEDNLRITGQGRGKRRTPQAAGRSRRWTALMFLVPMFLFLPAMLNPSPSPVDEPRHVNQRARGSAVHGVIPPPPPERQAAAPAPAETASVFSEEVFQDASYATDNEDLPPPGCMNYSFLLAGGDAVRLTSLFGLDVKTIVIDPGHGGIDAGAVGGSGVKEKNVTLDVALRLKARLKKRGKYNVLLTREKDNFVSLAKRVEFANSVNTDLFVSIHVNSLPNRDVNVIETYYFGPPQNDETLRLAQRENKDSNYSIGELKAIIQDISDTVKRQESVRLARAIQDRLLSNVRNYDADVLDTGVKVAPFVVLLGVEAPSVLAEISCITNEEEEGKLASEEYREKIASFLEEGIVRYLTKKSIQHVRGDDDHERRHGG